MDRSWECESLTDVWVWKLGTRPRSLISGNTSFESSLQCLQHRKKSYSSKLVKLLSIHLVLVNMPRKTSIKDSYYFLYSFFKRNHFVYFFLKIDTSSKNPLELAAEVSYPVSEIVIGGAMFLRYVLVGWAMFLRVCSHWLSNVSQVCSHWLRNVSQVFSLVAEQCF